VSIESICCLEVLIPSLLASVYGFAVIIRRYKGTYFSMGVLGVFCMFIGQLAYFMSMIAGINSYAEFHIGTLGSVGSCLFFLTANMGSVYMLADGDDEKVKRRAILAAAGPVFAALLYGGCVFLMNLRSNYGGLTVGIILTAITMLPIYFSTKAAIIPDAENGFFTYMRPYNRFVVALMLLNTLERGARNVWGGSPAEITLCYAFYAMIGLCTLAVIVFLKRGAERWRNI